MVPCVFSERKGKGGIVTKTALEDNLSILCLLHFVQVEFSLAVTMISSLYISLNFLKFFPTYKLDQCLDLNC